MTRALVVFALAAVVLSAQNDFSFMISRPAQVVAELEMSSPEADWGVKGREAAVADVRVDALAVQQVITYAGGQQHTYRIFLGQMEPGRHRLTVRRNQEYSALGAGLEVAAVRFHEYTQDDPMFQVLTHAPVLYARKNTIGRFSDVPLLAYCERLEEHGQPVLQYTVMFSNEDGGTSTRALMARWGRSTDIEYVYRVLLKPDGSKIRAIVQGRGHKDTEFRSPYEAGHPLLMPVTDNNMIAAAAGSPLRFQVAPSLVDLSRSSREAVMDANPVTYQVMAQELEREGKIRKFGTVDGENISDVRNYAYVEYQASHKDSALTVRVHLNDGRVYASDLGRIDLAIGRPGWVRSTVELPPGTGKSDLRAVEFECVVAPPSAKERPMPHSGTCRLEAVNKVFLLDQHYRPQDSWLKVADPVEVPTGRGVLFEP
jgi:hypothetical protein